jgi:hypothetical protein
MAIENLTDAAPAGFTFSGIQIRSLRILESGNPDNVEYSVRIKYQRYYTTADGKRFYYGAEEDMLMQEYLKTAAAQAADVDDPDTTLLEAFDSIQTAASKLLSERSLVQTQVATEPAPV